MVESAGANSNPKLDISDFIQQYHREYDYYDAASRFAAQLIESKLHNNGIRAIVTSRAKNPSRLEDKLNKRIVTKNKNYYTPEEVYKDIVDLAGVRIALYFNGERNEVEKIIEELFLKKERKEFPEKKSPEEELKSEKLKKRFSGYNAIHFRGTLKEEKLSEQQRKYSKVNIEIQIASVLMHAWSEVEHDLVYKPFQGELSVSELSILDELNGLVICGEIALERLQQAIQDRITNTQTDFNNHYELAVYLFKFAKDKFKLDENHLEIGEVEILYQFLKETQLLSPDGLTKKIDNLRPETDKRSISQQIVDMILSENDNYYKIYSKIVSTLSDKSKENKQAIGEFLTEWIKLEHLIRKLADQNSKKGFVWGFGALKHNTTIDEAIRLRIENLRQVRNYLVHGIETPDADSLDEYTKEIKKVIKVIEKK